MIKPSSTLPPVIKNADPREYYKVGSEFKKGDPRRTISRSDLVHILRNPLEWLETDSDEPTDAMDWGSLVDCLFLTPDRFEELYAVQPDVYPADKGEKPWTYQANYCKEWRDEQEAEGKTCVPAKLVERAKIAADKLWRDPILRSYRECCDTQVQVNVEWHASGMVIPMKAMIDLLPRPDSEYGDMVGDLKCYKNTDLDQWQRTVWYDCLDIQGAFYLACVNAATGLDYKQFCHVISRSSAPYIPARRILSPMFIGSGKGTEASNRGGYLQAIAAYINCLKTGEWPIPDDMQDGGWGVVEPSPYMVLQ